MIDEERTKMFFCLDNVRRWCKFVIIQGQNILDLSNEMKVLFEKMRCFDNFHCSDKNRMDDVSDLSRIEEYFFVISLNKAREWLIEGKQYIQEFEEMIANIDKELPFIKEVRNMREHEIEYYKSKGIKQKNFIRPLGEPGYAISDATSTIVDESGYFVGGRISVQVSIRLFNELHEKILIIQQKQIEI